MGERIPLLTGRAIGYRGSQVLGYVRETIASEGQAPSYGMIRDRFNLAHNGHVHDIIVRLEARGLLRRAGRGRIRRIRLNIVSGN